MDAPRRFGPLDVLLYLAGVALLAWALTTAWLAMRAVMDIGGMCASGGPYVVATPCPDGVPLLLFLAFPAGFLGVGMMVRWGSRLGGRWAALAGLAWPVLFLSLGWNFLEYGLSAPGGIELGWLIPGVMFVLMGGVPLVIGLRATRGPGGAASRGTPGTRHSTGRRAAAGGTPGSSPTGTSSVPTTDIRISDEQRMHRQLAGLLRQATRAAALAAADRMTVGEALGDGGSVPGSSMVDQLERLAALHRDGALGELEYLQAKHAVIDAASRGDVA